MEKKLRASPPPRSHSAPQEFATIIISARARSQARIEAKRRRENRIAEEHQIRWSKGIAELDSRVRPLLERAVEACVKEGIPATFEDNFDERAARPRLTFYCEAPDTKEDGRVIVGAASIKMIVESDGEQIIFGTARSFSTSPENMKPSDDTELSVSEGLGIVLETFFDKHLPQLISGKEVSLED